MESKHWTKNELVAYTLMYVAHSDLQSTKEEQDYMLSRVNAETFKDVKKEFDADNDYQSISKIVDAVKSEKYYNDDLSELFADIKLMAFADGKFDQMELVIYNQLKKILK